MVVIVTGAAGLIGGEACRRFAAGGYQVVGIDNDLRQSFFGPEASVLPNLRRLQEAIPEFEHHPADIRDADAIRRIFARHGGDVVAIVHAAGQPSHDWAAGQPFVDFSVNATGTLVLLEAMRRHCPAATFLFLSTNKVYGDRPNGLPLVELETRWEIAEDHPYFTRGIDEAMSIDATTHSLFGVSKAAADLLVQEYGRYFGLHTACFRGGCLTGPGHAGAQQHGFLSYLVRCAVRDVPYTVFGYGGKQVRDHIHAADLVAMLWEFVREPRCGEVYNVGGGRFSHGSVREAIALCEAEVGRPLRVSYDPQHRKGDHIWYVTDTGKFETHFPAWKPTHTLPATVAEMVAAASGASEGSEASEASDGGATTISEPARSLGDER